MESHVKAAGSEKNPDQVKIAKKMSFASVVAMPQTELVAPGALKPRNGNNAVITAHPGLPDEDSASLSSSLANLNIQGNGSSTPDNLHFTPRLDDERTHVSFSSVQAPSIASGLASALDEKESIRPDDSASVQAAEDDDSNSGSGRGSGAQNSRLGSEAGGKAFHSQLREISIQRGIPYPVKVDDRQEPAVGPQFSYWMPDEKLLEALESSKDRLFLLHLEQQIIAFVQTPGEGSFDLPPYNSFLRLLAHRLADYYRLSHFVEGPANAVRLYKTSTTQLPTPLSAFHPEETSEGVPQIVPSLKIMRRLGADGQLADSGTNTNSNSMAPSKATSEGSEHGDGLISPAESSSTKDRASRTREAREAKYKEARERIFADWKEESEKPPSADASAEASRASSVTGKRKKKRNKDQDDGFEARSAFYRQQSFDLSAGSGGYFVPYMVQPPTAMVQQPYNALFQPQYAVMQQPQMVPAAMMSPQPGPIMYQQPQVQQYPAYGIPQQQMMGAYYPTMPQQAQTPIQYPQQFIQPSYQQIPVQMSHPGPQTPNQSWNPVPNQNQYPGFAGHQGQYPTQSPQQIPSPSSNGIAIPYAYGQLPYQSHSPNNRNAHPLPGSYTRQGFTAQNRAVSGPIPQSNPQQPIQYSYQPQQQQIPVPMQQGQYMASAYGSPNSTSSRKHTAPHMHTPPSSTISKWGTPSTLPPKPPPPATTQMNDPGLPGRKPSSVGAGNRRAA